MKHRPSTLMIIFIFLLSASLLQSRAALATEEPLAVSDMHATAFHYFFQDGDMDFHFGNLILGSAVHGGAGIGEAFYAASRIQDGDAGDWQREWAELAGRVEARGETSLAAGHLVSARDQLLRAAYYYRLSLVSMLPDNPAQRGEARSGTLQRAQLSILRSGSPLRGTSPDTWRFGDRPVKTLLMIGGGPSRRISSLYRSPSPPELQFRHGGPSDRDCFWRGGLPSSRRLKAFGRPCQEIGRRYGTADRLRHQRRRTLRSAGGDVRPAHQGRRHVLRGGRRPPPLRHHARRP